jgi:hypothetical protein
MKLMSILLEESVKPATIKWSELSVQKLRDLGFDTLKSGVKLPSEQGGYKLVWGAAIVAKPGSREEAAAMRSAEAKLRRYKEDIENRFDVNDDTEVSFDKSGIAAIPGVQEISPEEREERAAAYADLKAKGIKKGNWTKD